MLLVLEPLPLILLTIVKGIDAIALTLTFYIFSLIDITILIYCLTFTLRLTRHHLALVFTPVFRCC